MTPTSALRRLVEAAGKIVYQWNAGNMVDTAQKTILKDALTAAQAALGAGEPVRHRHDGLCPIAGCTASTALDRANREIDAKIARLAAVEAEREMLQRVVDDKYPAPPNFYLSRLQTDLREAECKADAAYATGHAAGVQEERERCAREVERDRTWGADAVRIQHDLAAALRAPRGEEATVQSISPNRSAEPTTRNTVQPTPETVERVKALEDALRGLLSLVDDGLLQRNTANDTHFPSYMGESVRIVKAIQAAQQQIALADGLAALREAQ